MIDKWLSASSFLALRFTEKEYVDFTEKLSYRHPEIPSDNNRTLIHTVEDIDKSIRLQIDKAKESNAKLGILLSGGMDSGILASYCKGADAYTFRFSDDKYLDELHRAEQLAKRNNLTLHYCDINWDTVRNCLNPVMLSKGGPVHSIEPQIYQAAIQAKADSIDLMIFGDASDYVFGGMDKLLSKDWSYDEFIERYIYVDPYEILVEPRDYRYVFEGYRIGNEAIDFVSVLNRLAAQESYGSYNNAFLTANLNYLDPYECMKMADNLDLFRVRNGESKYLIRELFRMRYPDIPVPEKIPMPRPVDIYFKDWQGPVRSEFRKDINISKYNGNQKWLIWCLEQFFNLVDTLS